METYEAKTVTGMRLQNSRKMKSRSSRKKNRVLSVLIGFELFLFGCTMASLTACQKENNEKDITFVGSNTSHELISIFAEEFNKDHESIAVHSVGGGSERSIEKFLKGELLYLNSSRKLTEEEINSLEKMEGVEVHEVIIGLDALAIIVNPRLCIHELTLQELTQIFEGKITNWSEVGGADWPIQVYGRTPSSGTYSFVKEKFVRSGFARSMVCFENPQDIVRKVKLDVNGIGYVDMASISKKAHLPMDGIWPLSIKIEGAASVSPFQMFEVLNGNYPLTRPLYQYISSKGNSKVKDFIFFELSEKGQKIIEKNGFLPLQAIHKTFNAENGF